MISKQVLILSFCILFRTVSSELSDETKLNLILKFKKNFQDQLKSDQDLKQFQQDILIKRNSECVSYESFNYEELKKNNLKLDALASNFADYCPDFDRLKKAFFVSNLTNNKNKENFIDLIITQFVAPGCDFCNQHEPISLNKEFKIWFYGISASTLITLSSFAGAFLIPLTKHKYYKRILMFLISVAIGTLCGTGFLHLIPQAYGVSEDINYNFNNMYIWKSLVILGGLYLFFLVEQIMRFFIQFRKHKKEKKLNKTKTELELKPLNVIEFEKVDKNEDEDEDDYEYKYETEDDLLSLKLAKPIQGSVPQEINKIHLSHSELDHAIAPVAWIIICGEGLHNFIDGLSIGAAFTESILKGLSLSLAIICEEFPHKLGDFAILIAAGMPLRVALICNFLSSCFIYLGMAIGIILGENLHANMWIYAIAGGMFIYIAVCDMIPELGEMGLEIEKENVKENLLHPGKETTEKFAVKIKIQNILIQNFGILLGFICMLLLALYAKKISL